MKGKRLLELDALRGLAAISVVLYHYFYNYGSRYGHAEMPTDWSILGKYGVQLFFMVSGFVIFWTLNRTDRPLDFIVSRFSRLYPGYWFALFLTFSLVSYFDFPGYDVGLVDFLYNLTMLQEMFGRPHVDGVYWTLTVELIFYFWMFSAYITGNINKINTICIALLLLSISHSIELITLPKILYKILLLEYLPFFFAGICFYSIMAKGASMKSSSCLAISLLSTLVIYSLEAFVVFAFFYLIFLLLINNKLTLLVNKPLLYLGAISYSLYLVHQNIGYMIINKFYLFNLNPMLGIATAILVSLVLASISHELIEKTSIKFIRNTYKKSKFFNTDSKEALAYIKVIND